MSRDGIGWPRTATNGLRSATDSALHRMHAYARLHEPAAPLIATDCHGLPLIAPFIGRMHALGFMSPPRPLFGSSTAAHAQSWSECSWMASIRFQWTHTM
jgi:hypothetical protein